VKIKAPKFFNDVYRDLRDRHLLLPAVVLLVALVAVPVVLRKPAEEVPPPPAAAAPADTSAVTAAVLVDDSVDVRDYRKRLAQLKSKNPFEANIKVETSGGSGGSGDGSTSTDTSGTGSSTTPVDTGASTGAPTDTGSTIPDVPSDTTTPDTTTPDTGGGSTDTPTQPEIRFVAGRVDVTVGPIGKGKDINNVKYLTFLPDDEDPIAAFVGLTGSGDERAAVFALTSFAEVLDGDGTCAPHKPEPCQFLTLHSGEQRYIRYNDQTYRLKVRDTRLVDVEDPSDQSAQGDDSVTDGTNDGGNGNSDGTKP
jgi:hypothetical protein